MQFQDIVNKYNRSSLKAQGYNTSPKHKLSVVVSDAEKEKLVPVLKKYNLTLSEYLRYAIHVMADRL
jgi:hypothetical protein